MRKKMFVTIFVGMILLMSMGYSDRVIAEVKINVGINVPPPPPLVIPAPPPVIVIPNTYVYFPTEVEADILFYHGYWYRPYHERWYRSGSYKGPWVYIVPERVPPAVLHLPPNYRHVPPGHERIPHGQLKKNWRTWEREKHWDKHEYEHKGEERHEIEKGEHQQGKGSGKGKHGD
jgi:hypothetical protein